MASGVSDGSDEMWLANLHDVFMTGNLLRTLMEDQLLEEDAEQFLMSNRGRLERCWQRNLYVLIEAWQRMPARRQGVFRSWAPDAYRDLDELLATPHVQEAIGHMHAVRDYLSHRDTRRYWNVGRYAQVLAGVEVPRELNTAFGGYFLTAMKIVRDS